MGPAAYLATATMPGRRNPAPRTQFAKRLQEWAGEHGITRRDLEKATGYKSAQIGNFLRGDYGPSREFMAALIRAYELPAEEWWTAAGYNATTQEPLDERKLWVKDAVDEAFSRLEWARLIAYRDKGIRQLLAAYDVRSVSIDLLLADTEERVREGLIEEERAIRTKQGLPPEGGIFT